VVASHGFGDDAEQLAQQAVLVAEQHRIAANALSQPAPSKLLYLADDTRDQAAHEGWTIAF